MYTSENNDKSLIMLKDDNVSGNLRCSVEKGKIHFIIKKFNQFQVKKNIIIMRYTISKMYIH